MTKHDVLDKLIQNCTGTGQSEGTLLAEHLEDIRSDDTWDLALVQASLGEIEFHARRLQTEVKKMRIEAGL